MGKKYLQAGDVCSSVVECLSYMYKVLGPTPRTVSLPRDPQEKQLFYKSFYFILKVF